MNIVYKEWLPDQPELGNPGLLDAQNVIASEEGYEPFLPLATANAVTADSRPRGAIAFDWPGGGHVLYAGTTINVLRSLNFGAWTTLNSSALATSSYWRFAIFEELLIATNYSSAPQTHTAGGTSALSDLATSGTAPSAQHVAVIGQHVMFGHLNDSSDPDAFCTVQWGAIGNARSWPTPGSTTAIANQAGIEPLNPNWGTINGLAGGDQFGLAFQSGGITRMTYIGGNTVFQFDELAKSNGCFFPNSIVSKGQLWYYASIDGFYVTDGVTTRSIGAGRINRYFQKTVDLTARTRLYGALDAMQNLIYWCYTVTGATGGRPNRLLIYNIDKDRFTRADQELESLCEFAPSVLGNVSAFTPLTRLIAFHANNTPGIFNGTPGTAVIESGEMELNEGGRTYLDAVKPHVQYSGSAPTVGVRIATRDDLGANPSYTATAGANSRTGFANFRADAKYHRVEVNIAGSFEKVTGFEFSAVPSGAG